MTGIEVVLAGQEVSLIGLLLGALIGNVVQSNVSPEFDRRTGRNHHPRTYDFESNEKGFVMYLLGHTGAIGGSLLGGVIGPKISPEISEYAQGLSEIHLLAGAIVVLLVLYRSFQSRYNS